MMMPEELYVRSRGSAVAWLGGRTVCMGTPFIPAEADMLDMESCTISDVY